MRTQNGFQKIHLTLLALCATFAFAVFWTKAAGSGIIRFQESSGPSSENSSGLIGHWRKTTIGYTGPIDEHLVLHSNGTVENWTVTAYERREPVTGHWSVEGKTLTLSFGGNDRSNPFTFYQGQLVFPTFQIGVASGKKSSSKIALSGNETAHDAEHVPVKFEI